jgi:hypothetical protein
MPCPNRSVAVMSYAGITVASGFERFDYSASFGSAWFPRCSQCHDLVLIRRGPSDQSSAFQASRKSLPIARLYAKLKP